VKAPISEAGGQGVGVPFAKILLARRPFIRKTLPRPIRCWYHFIKFSILLAP